MFRSLAAALVLLPASAALAEVPFAATLSPVRACPASPSIRGQFDAQATLRPGQRYRAVAKNKEDATFYQVLVGGERLWASIGCFAAEADAVTQPPASPPSAPVRQAAASYVLAMSWQPAFCAGHPRSAECSLGGNGGLGLHGLWPQPIGTYYCGVDQRLADADRHNDWAALPDPVISPATRTRLARVMPGLRSGLQRHEWIKHGTCSGLNADGYFARAAELAEEVLGSDLAGFLQQRQGRELTVGALREGFDQALGNGTGARVTMSCGNQGRQRDVTEFVIGLAGDVTGAAPLRALVLGASPAKPGCPAGILE